MSKCLAWEMLMGHDFEPRNASETNFAGNDRTGIFNVGFCGERKVRDLEEEPSKQGRIRTLDALVGSESSSPQFYAVYSSVS